MSAESFDAVLADIRGVVLITDWHLDRLAAAHAAEVAKCAEAIPTNWCDPLLTGPDAVLRGKGGTWGCPDIERLLSSIRNRIAAIANQEPPHDR